MQITPLWCTAPGQTALLIQHQDQTILVDPGIGNADSRYKVRLTANLDYIKQQSLNLEAIFISTSHTNSYGGLASWWQQLSPSADVFAPAVVINRLSKIKQFAALRLNELAPNQHLQSQALNVNYLPTGSYTGAEGALLFKTATESVLYFKCGDLQSNIKEDYWQSNLPLQPDTLIIGVGTGTPAVAKLTANLLAHADQRIVLVVDENDSSYVINQLATALAPQGFRFCLVGSATIYSHYVSTKSQVPARSVNRTTPGKLIVVISSKDIDTLSSLSIEKRGNFRIQPRDHLVILPGELATLAALDLLSKDNITTSIFKGLNSLAWAQPDVAQIISIAKLVSPQNILLIGNQSYLLVNARYALMRAGWRPSEVTVAADFVEYLAGDLKPTPRSALPLAVHADSQLALEQYQLSNGKAIIVSIYLPVHTKVTLADIEITTSGIAITPEVTKRLAKMRVFLIAKANEFAGNVNELKIELHKLVAANWLIGESEQTTTIISVIGPRVKLQRT